MLLAMERATYTTKSFLLALALVHKQITAEQAALAAQVEVSSQIQTWGEVEDCASILHLYCLENASADSRRSS